MANQLATPHIDGLFVEVFDEFGNTLGQALYADWPGCSPPAVGESMGCVVTSPVTGQEHHVIGRVQTQHFEVQRYDDGRPCVWVRVMLNVSRVIPSASRPAASPQNTPHRVDAAHPVREPHWDFTQGDFFSVN
jgi:hypothetical protein